MFDRTVVKLFSNSPAIFGLHFYLRILQTTLIFEKLDYDYEINMNFQFQKCGKSQMFIFH